MGYVLPSLAPRTTRRRLGSALNLPPVPAGAVKCHAIYMESLETGVGQKVAKTASVRYFWYGRRVVLVECDMWDISVTEVWKRVVYVTLLEEMIPLLNSHVAVSFARVSTLNARLACVRVSRAA